jgi:Zinc knuckle
LNNKRQRSPNNSEYSGYHRPQREERGNFNSANINIEDSSSSKNHNFNMRHHQEINSNEIDNSNEWMVKKVNENTQSNSQGFSSTNDVKWNEDTWGAGPNTTTNDDNYWSSSTNVDQGNKNNSNGFKRDSFDRNYNIQNNNNNNSRSRNNRPTGKPCYNCGEYDHLSISCNNAKKSDNNRGGKICFTCKKEGHIANNCPNSNRNHHNNIDTFKKPNLCFNCLETGHKMINCPHPKNNHRRNDSNFRRDFHSNRNMGQNQAFDSKIEDKAEEKFTWGNLQNYEADNNKKIDLDDENKGINVKNDKAPNKEETWETNNNNNGNDFNDDWM